MSSLLVAGSVVLSIGLGLVLTRGLIGLTLAFVTAGGERSATSSVRA